MKLQKSILDIAKSFNFTRIHRKNDAHNMIAEGGRSICGWSSRVRRLSSSTALGKMDDIVKSPLDKRSYRYLKLANELRAVVVSDEKTEKASATLSVRVGALSDPDDIPGLAHFCEHMLFLGTEKYPNENDYSEFVIQNGGSANAFTSDEFTMYYFDVASDHLRGALDRFSQFFICPLFNEDSKDREVNAVDSENSMYLQEDSARVNQICRTHSRPGHPYKKFITGNKETLEHRPKELGIDVRKALLDFHSTYYSSNVMTVSVLGKESLDELENLTRELFSPIINKSVPIQTFPEHPYSENETKLWLEIVPVKDKRKLKFEFPLPDLTDYYDSSPCNYVANLIGHESKGSLLSLLRNKGWSNDLYGGPAIGAKGFMFFTVGMDLTEEGEGHVEDITTALFQYLAMMKAAGPQEWFFKECSDLSKLKFRFKEAEKPCYCTQNIAYSLNYYSPKDVLCGDVLTTYRPDLIQQVLDQLTPHNIRVYVLSTKFKDKTELVEPWYGTHYNARKVDPEVIQTWSSAQPIPELHLPEPNKFIPTDFDLVPRNEEDGSDGANTLPVLIKNTPMIRVWYKQDETFLCPKASLSFFFRTPMAYQDATSYAQISLFTDLLEDALKEFAYDADLAGITYFISNFAYGIMLTVEGYNHKQSVLLSRIMSQMTTFVVDPKKFEIFKEIKSRQYKNFVAEQPYKHAMHWFSAVVASCKWTTPEVAAALEGVTCENLQEFIGKYFSRIHIEALLIGNLSQKDSLDLVEIVEEAIKSNLDSQPLLSPMKPITQVILPDNSASLYTTENTVHSSCCVQLYIQIGLENTRRKMLSELLTQILLDPCFNVLRTQEQLGYIVTSGLICLHGIVGFRVLIQSSKSSDFVERRMEHFLLETKNYLESLPDEEFEKNKKALAVKRSEKPKSLAEECSKYKREMLMLQYHFNRDNVEISCLETLSKDDLVAFYKEYVVPGAPQRRKVSIHVIPSVTEDQTDEGKSSEGKSNEEKKEGKSSEKKKEGKSNEEKKEGKSNEEKKEGKSSEEKKEIQEENNVVVEPLDELDGQVMEPTLISDIAEFKQQLSLYPPLESYSKDTMTT